MLFGIVGVFAVDQGAQVDVDNVVSVAIAPATITFGLVVPGATASATNGPITLNAAGSNVDVSVVVSVLGEPFAGGLMFNAADADSFTATLVCVSSGGGACTYDILSITPTLVVPVGSPAGTKTGMITYTFTGPIPA